MGAHQGMGYLVHCNVTVALAPWDAAGGPAQGLGVLCGLSEDEPRWAELVRSAAEGA